MRYQYELPEQKNKNKNQLKKELKISIELHKMILDGFKAHGDIHPPDVEMLIAKLQGMIGRKN